MFPISFIVPDDQGIGQRPEVIMPYVDYFSPMVYPVHYGPGVFDVPVPNDYPYEMIDETLEIMNEQAEGLPVRIRPWIQDFGYGRFPPYTAAQVQAEMSAAADNGARGLDDLERARHLHRGRARPAARGRGRRPGHRRRVRRASVQPAPSGSP